MSSNESWVIEKVTEFHNALICRFREEIAIQTSFRNVIKLEQTKFNNAQLQLMALRKHNQTLSDKLFVKGCVQEIFSNVLNKADLHAKDSMFLRENALQSDYEAKLQHDVYEYELKMVEDKCSIQTLSNKLNAANNSKEELYQRVSTAEIACLQKEVEVERLHREIAACAAVFNDKICAEVLAAKVAFNEELVMQALELAAHFDRKLVVELAAVKVFAVKQHSAELEVLN